MVPFSPEDAAAAPPVVESLAPAEQPGTASTANAASRARRGRATVFKRKLRIRIKNTRFGKP